MKLTSRTSRLARIGRVGGLALAAACLVGLSLPSAASAATLDSSTVAQLHAKMTDIGIDSATQDSLLDKLSAGKPLDSNSGAQPVRRSTVSLPGGNRTVEEFADGSKRWIQVERAHDVADALTRADVSSCVASGGWVVNCRVSVSDIISEARFDIDYKTSSSGAAQLRDYRSATCGVPAGSCSVGGGIKRGTQNASGPAWAELSYTASFLALPSVSGAFGIRVSGNSVSTY